MDAWIRNDVLTGRAGVDGLRTLLYGRTHRRRLHRQLGDLLGPESQITRCDLERTKFKPGRKLTGYYVATVAGPHPTRRAIEVVWAGDERSGEVDLDEAAMQEEARLAGVAAPFRGLCARPTTGPTPAVHVAPLDVVYPQLVRLSQPDHVRRVVDAVVANDRWRAATTYGVTALRYRPRQRHVLRYDPGGVPGAESVFAKLYRNGAALEAVDVAGHIADLLDRSGGRIASVRPLGRWAPDDVVLYPRVPGRPLSHALREPVSGWDGYLVTAGVLLRTLHEDGAANVPTALREHGLNAEL